MRDGKKDNDESLGSWRTALGPVAPYLGLGMQLAAIVLFFLGGGYLLDVWLGTMPGLTIVGAFVGMIMMFLQLWRAAQDMTRRSRKPPPRNHGGR